MDNDSQQINDAQVVNDQFSPQSSGGLPNSFFSKKIFFLIMGIIGICIVFLIIRIFFLESSSGKSSTLPESKAYSLTQQDMGKTIHIKPNDTITVSLPISPSLGLVPLTQI